MTIAPTSRTERTPDRKPEGGDTPETAIGRRTKIFGIVAILGAFLGSYGGLRLADHQSHPAAKASAALTAKVVKVVRSAADKTAGLTVSGTSGGSRVPTEGESLAVGTTLQTDARTRARIALSDGSELVMDRSTSITLGSEPRSLRLTEGSAIVEAAHVDGAPPLRLTGESGEVKVIGTRLVLTQTPERANVEVLRGEVEVVGGGGSAKVFAGQEAVLTKTARPEVVPATDMAKRSAFGEALVVHNEDTEPETSGLGELRAKKPGKTDEKDHAVRLSRHDVKVRIAGAVARTEIEEVFSNDTDDELEGLYRFPLPSGAQIERLALDVDGKLVEGEFVDASRAQAIWRGVIHNAAPTAPKPREELVWVPGPWRDPALLEWKRGGRFELKIFPIPKRGSRRVVIAYTETVAPSSGVRRYTYPLPHATASDLVIEKMHVDAKVVGFDKADEVRVRGYELRRGDGPKEVTFTADETSFRPSGDLVIEYGTGDKGSPMSSYAFTTAARDGKPGEHYATIALRPTLPKWTDVRPRDQVIVVDTGRSMFGERFQRARRLAAQIVQEMDRRDRVTVIACDIRCKPLAAGFVGPGSGAAHDVDAFLSAMTPDGASDLVGAVDAASKVQGHDGARDLRITLLSSGNATAGHKSLGRVAAEVHDRVGAALATQVSAVPIGSDADVALLGEIAKGGGGVVVPYQPGERLAQAAFSVLNASYGTVLRDATLTLPEGLADSAPSVLPPLRAGGETLVAARMTRDKVEGEVILRGTVGGEPFEQKVPLALVATDAPANAFVPRIFAEKRIADRELVGGPGAKAELVDLSKRFAVPSRATSLLVLESEAMFQAFGVGRTKRDASFTGDEVALGTVAKSGAPDAEEKAEASDKGKSRGDEADDTRDLGGLGSLGFRAPAEPSPKKESRDIAPSQSAPAAAPITPVAPSGAGAATESKARRAAPDWNSGRGRGGGEWMRRVWRRVAQVHEGSLATVPSEKLTAARTALLAAPDERNRHRDLAKLLAQTNDLQELEAVLTKWNERDPLDADAVAWRSDLMARKGEREAAMRVLTGALSSPTLTPREASKLAQAAAETYERMNDSAACSLRVAASELASDDVDMAARAVLCEEAAGRTKSGERLRAAFNGPKRAALEAAITRFKNEKSEGAHGDVVVSATWEGPEDLDLAIVDPSGARASLVSRMPGVHVVSPMASGHEELGIANAKAGAFVVEVVRGTRGTRPVSGTVKISSGGQVKSVPFVLTDSRVVVGRVDAHYEETLVSERGESFTGGGVPIVSRAFDRAGAQAALFQVNVQSCARGGASGPGHVMVTFLPNGGVGSAILDSGPFQATSVGGCIAGRFRALRVAPFVGAPVSIGRSFSITARPGWMHDDL